MMGKQGKAAKKSRVVRGNVLVCVLLAVSVVCATVYAREGQDGPLHRVQAVFGMAAAPLQLAGTGVAFAADAAGDTVENATAPQSSYTALQQENAQLKAQLAQMEEYRLENERLSGLLEIQGQYQIEGVTARVIGSSSDSYSQDVTVGAGSNSGVQLGQAVIGPTGLLGHVVEVSPLTCRVRLLADPQSGVSVYVQDSRAEGVVKGSVDGMLRLEHVDSSVQVEVGDVIVTSGMGGSYPAGLVVGTVTNVTNAAGTTDRTIIVTALSEADPLEEVTVIASASAPSDGASAPEDGGSDAQDGPDGSDADGSQNASGDAAAQGE